MLSIKTLKYMLSCVVIKVLFPPIKTHLYCLKDILSESFEFFKEKFIYNEKCGTVTK